MNTSDFQSLVERLRNILSTPYQDADTEHPDDQLMGDEVLAPADELEPETPYVKHPAQGKLVGELEERYREFLAREPVEETPVDTASQTTKTPQELAAEKQSDLAATKLAQTTGASPEDLKAAMSAAEQGQVPSGGAAKALASVGDELAKSMNDPQLAQQLLKTVQAAKTQ
jgi:hypothetical protein